MGPRPGEADDRVEHEVGLGGGDQVAHARVAGEHPRPLPARRRLLGRLGVGERDLRTRCSRACSHSRSQRWPAESPAARARSEPATTSSACSPIDPVEPRIRTFLAWAESVGRRVQAHRECCAWSSWSLSAPTSAPRAAARRAAALGVDCVQIFLGNRRAGRSRPRATTRRAARLGHRPLRPRALPDQRLLAEAEHPLRLAQDPPADLRRRRDGRRGGADRPPGPCRGRDRRGGRALAAHARDARVRRARSTSRTRPAARTRSRGASTRWRSSGTRSRPPTPTWRSASASTPATPTPPARTSQTSSSGCARSPAGSTSATPTTRATRRAPAPTATPTSARARWTPTPCAR